MLFRSNNIVGSGANAFASATIAGANTISVSAFDKANTAFDKANTALSNTSGVSFNGNLYFPTGNVGIGTTTPAGKLHARYDAGAGDSYTAKYIFQNSDQKLTLGTYYRAGIGQYASIDSSDNAGTGNSDLLFMTGGTERIRLLNNGNLGINIAIPTSTLHVNGTTNTKNLIVNNADIIATINGAN